MSKEMLAAGERNSDIAAAIGFADEFHFSRSFRKISAMSPRQYLKEEKKTRKMQEFRL